MARDAQLDLFGGGAPHPGAEDPVGPAAPAPDLSAVAACLPPGLRLGTSSWSFPGWAGIVYDRPAPDAVLARRGLAAYARHPLLRAVGLDRTFYAPLPAEAYLRYAADVPEGFRFLVKAARECTSPTLRDAGGAMRRNPRFLDPAFAAESVVGPARQGLGGRLGAVLFQFPPVSPAHMGQPEAFLGRLGGFLRDLPRGPLYAVEIRNRELLAPAYRKALGAAGAAHAFNVHPAMPSPAEQARAAPLADQPALVVRWMLGHGRGYQEARDLYAPFDSLAAPDPASRGAIAALCREAARLGLEATVVVNNKAEGSAPRSAFELARQLAADAG